MSGSFTRNLDLLERPVQFHMYNFTMQSVDIFDNYLHRNNLYIRYKDPKQWKTRFVLTLVGFMLVNTYLKFKDKNSGTKTNSTIFRNHLFFEFVSVTNSSFFTPQSNLDVENRRGSKFRCVLCNSPNRTQTRHKCQICHGACCQSHYFSNCENCLTDSALNVSLPVTIRPYKPKRIFCKFHGSGSKTSRHSDRCLLLFCRELVVCSICSNLSSV